MNKILRYKRKIAFLLYTCMTITILLSVGMLTTSTVQAKKTQKKNILSKKKITLIIGDNSADKTVLKVQYPTAKVIWKTSNKKVVALKKITGKKKQNIVLQAKKEGSAVVTAKIGKKKLKCKIFVKAVEAEEDIITNSVTSGAVGVYVTSATASKSAISVTVKFYNGSEKDACCSTVFSIEKWVDGQWKEVESAKKIAYTTVAYILRPQGEGEHTYKITETKEPLTTGKYRINTDLSAQAGIPVSSSAEFYLTVN